MSNYLYGSLSLKISEKGLLIRGSLVQAHPEAQESQEQSWDFLLHKAFLQGLIMSPSAFRALAT
jgi:hypothetical protein